MKKYLLISSFLLSITAAVAQNKPVSFGVKAGLTISNIHSTSSTDITTDNYAGGPYNSTAGFFVEGTADIALGKAWSLMPGLSFTGKGAEGPVENTKHLYYAEIPVSLTYNIYNGADRFSIGGGMYAGYLLSDAESEYNREGLPYTSYPAGVPIDGQYFDYYRKFDYGINIVGSYSFGKHIALNAAYQFGLPSVRNKEFGDDFKLQNRVFKLGVGYNF